MKTALMTSAAALLMALGTAIPASAQTIDGTAISASDLPYVQARCDALKIESGVAPSQDNDSNTDMSDEQDDDADEGDNALSTFDLDTLTVEQCEEGGLVDSAM
ncbi:hypothetical protein [Mariluticola halotolerans]|uniref:hypothetical protein n=1 Tax=Mariluticola halotolerans TaxID=2909283 RepID=UPI0026E377D5|nr:hypothetical protein [Mariluticola halotolerans]UJQ94571.1 hypothetical protein L1P08_00820 [Mariluticola halotolerans]